MTRICRSLSSVKTKTLDVVVKQFTNKAPSNN